MTATEPCPTCGGNGENPAAETDLDQLLLGACPDCDGGGTHHPSGRIDAP